MTANDSDVSDGDTLTGSQVVRVYGQNLTAPFVTLTFGEVEYTPLTQGEGYIEFILSDNGTATINVDGNRFMSFEVEGIIRPFDIPNAWIAQQLPNSLSRWEEGINTKAERVYCINYPYEVSSSYAALGFRFGEPKSDFDFNRLTPHNCTIGNTWITPGGYPTFVVAPIDQSLPIYIEIDNYVVAVSNYTTD